MVYIESNLSLPVSLSIKREELRMGTSVKRDKYNAERHGRLHHGQCVKQETNTKMPDYKLTRDEMEPIIRGSAGSREWEIITADPKIIRRMDKQGYRPDGKQNPHGFLSFTVPADRVRIGKAEKAKRGFAAKKSVGLHNNVTSGNQNSPGMVG
jgi:hypothetical protein